MTLSPPDALAQKLGALAAIACNEGWCTRDVVFLATPNRNFRETEGDPLDTRTLLSVRCGSFQGNGSILLAPQVTGWEDAEPFLLLSTAALTLDGHVYDPQVATPVGPAAIPGVADIGSAHDQLACRARMEAHLTALGWVPGASIGGYTTIDNALTAITNARPNCRK
jgi:hypothetical protein